MNYYQQRQLHQPIGSGITEATCKLLIGQRTKNSGQRWSQTGISAVLNLRAIDQSDRFDQFWTLFAQRYRDAAIGPIELCQ